MLYATASAAGRSTTTRTWFYAVGGGYTAWERYDHNRIDLIPEKKTYRPGETARLNVRGSDLGVLIGRRGEKLASLQHIVNLIVAKKEGEYHRIAVDVENYRGRREEQLRDVADRAAKRVLQTGKIIQLEPMPAIERRIVHMALVENPGVRTQSVGVEPNRRIVILPATKVE